MNVLHSQKLYNMMGTCSEGTCSNGSSTGSSTSHGECDDMRSHDNGEVIALQKITNWQGIIMVLKVL